MASWETDLHKAVYEDKFADVRTILESAEVKNKGNLGRGGWPHAANPLHQAAYHGKNEMIRILHNAGFDLNSYHINGGYRYSSLHWAVMGNKPSTVKLLLDLGANSAIQGNKASIAMQCVPQELAQYLGFTPIVAIISQGKTPQVAKTWWEGQLYDAVTSCNLSEVKSILARSGVRASGDLGRKEWKERENPLHHAAFTGRNEMIKIMKDAGFDLDSYYVNESYYKFTCLHMAVYGNKTSTVKLLLDLGADWKLSGTMDDYSGDAKEFAQRLGYPAIANVIAEYQEFVSSFEKLDSMAKVMEKSVKKKDLEEAKKFQNAIREKTSQMEKLGNVILEAEINLKNDKERLKTLAKELEDWPGFKYTSMLTKQVDEIENIIRTFKESTTDEKKEKKKEKEKEEDTCSICFMFPQQVFSCMECDNWVCQDCREQLSYNSSTVAWI